MNERIDEEIGALLDGRLEPRRRDELLTRLATDGDDYDVFADTAAVLREAEEGESAAKGPVALPRDEPNRPADVIPLHPRRATGWRSPAVRSLAAAAVLAAIALPVLRSRMNERAWRDPARLAALATEPGSRLPVGWDRSWDRNRGGGGSISANTGVAARLGALDVDARVAAAAGDTASVADLARKIAALADDITGGGSISNAYHEVEAESHIPGARLQQDLDAARKQAEPFLDRDYLALGAWTEAARLAAAHRDAAFFHHSATRAALKTALELTDLGDTARAAADRIRLFSDRRAVPDWTALASDLDTLLQGLAR